MYRKIRNICHFLLVCCLMFTIGSCDQEDDVMSIFNNKTWKLTRISFEESSQPFFSGLWSNAEEQKASLDRLNKEGNFTLKFNLAGSNEQAVGTVTIRGYQASITDAPVNINGKTQSILVDGKVQGTESDKLGKAFINGMKNVFKYVGDEHSLTLFFKDGQTTKVMGFVPQ